MTGARAAVDGTPTEARPEDWHRISTPASSIGPWLPEGALGSALAEGLLRVEEALTAAVGSEHAFIREAAGHLMSAGGKRFRPMLALLAAQLGDPRAPGVTEAAVVCELTHLATLYHDDVMDEAVVRRGAPSANSRWTNSIAILTGDLLFARASDLLADLGPEAVRIQAQTFERLVTGQIRETVGAQPGDDPVDHYLEVLADKTTRWQRVTVPGWYGEGDRVVEICSGTAVWRHAGLPVVPIRWVLLRDPQRRFDPQALLCTDTAQDPLQVVRWFVQRWKPEVTFREVRDHLGVETQRRWSGKAIARTTPCLLGLFSIVTLLATRLGHHARLRVSSTAWYRKAHPTFSDTLAAVRRRIWAEQGLVTSRLAPETAKLRPTLREGIACALRHAA
mgnify:CR=1 FL=1